MKIMKFGLVLLLPAIFVLSGCGKKAEAPANTPDSPAVETEAPKIDTPSVDTQTPDSTKKDSVKTEVK